MRVRLVLPFFFAFLSASYILAQETRVTLQVIVFAEGEPHPIEDPIMVTLLDSWGSAEAEVPTTNGFAAFLTTSDLHRLRITGPTIEQYDGDVRFLSTEAARTERVEVARKLIEKPRSEKGTIPAVRMRIPAKARKEYEKGRTLEGENWSEARMHMEKAISIYADYDLAYNELGVIEQRTGNKDEAQKAFSKAVRINPEFARASRNLGRILLAEKKYSEAEEALKKALHSEPLDPWTLTFTSYAEMQLGKYDEAIANAGKVHALSHNGFADAHLILARCFEALHHPQEALEQYKLYLTEDPAGSKASFARLAVQRLSPTGP